MVVTDRERGDKREEQIAQRVALEARLTRGCGNEGRRLVERKRRQGGRKDGLKKNGHKSASVVLLDKGSVATMFSCKSFPIWTVRNFRAINPAQSNFSGLRSLDGWNNCIQAQPPPPLPPLGRNSGKGVCHNLGFEYLRYKDKVHTPVKN